MPRESKTARKARTLRIIEALEQAYPNTHCALDHDNPLQLLVATILSAQCTDRRVNRVTPELFATYRSARDFADADPDALAEQVRSTGFYRNKSRNIIAACRTLADDHGGQVPRTMDELLALPGVARKTANVVLSNAFDTHEGVVVDTHVKRLAGRLKLSAKAQPDKIEKDLMELVPRERWGEFSHLLIFHGRGCCTARKPSCPECPLAGDCPSAGKV
jgi:endonuclease-3